MVDTYSKCTNKYSLLKGFAIHKYDFKLATSSISSDKKVPSNMAKLKFKGRGNSYRYFLLLTLARTVSQFLEIRTIRRTVSLFFHPFSRGGKHR